jgi:hypothetical protein
VRRFVDSLIVRQGGKRKPLRTALSASDATFHKSSFFCSRVRFCRRLLRVKSRMVAINKLAVREEGDRS